MKRKKILLVDDDTELRELVCEVLSLGSYEVTGVRNGLEALLYLESMLTDLIILDWNMPVMSGEEFLKRREAIPHFKSIPVLIVTAQASDQFEAVTSQYTVVRKPFPIEELLDSVIQVMGKEF